MTTITCRYLKNDSANIRPKSVGDARALVGMKVEYLRQVDIDKSGRGYFFPRTGTVVSAKGRNIEIEQDWVGLTEIVELRKIEDHIECAQTVELSVVNKGLA